MLIGVQLYTLREELNKDFLGTLKKVKEIGYDGVEFAGFGGYEAAELKKYLEDINLKVISAHIGLEELKANLDEVIKFNLELGNKYIVCPWANYESIEDFIEMSGVLEDIGERLNKVGLKLCYHNHAQEFQKFQEGYGLDIIYGKVSEQFLSTEIDTYWVAYAGINPVEYIKKYKNRTPLVHIKDMEEGGTKSFTEIGNGILDIKSIVKQVEKNGAEWIIVEQDLCKRAALESIEISLKNLRELL